MLETNLKMLQEEFKRQKINEKGTENSSYVSFSGVQPDFDESRGGLSNGDSMNPFESDSEDEYDASGKNPFAE